MNTESLKLLNNKLYDDLVESYLKGIYGVNWSKEKLIYRKWSYYGQKN